MKTFSFGFITLVAAVLLALSFACPAGAAVIGTSTHSALSASANPEPILAQASTNPVLLADNDVREGEDPFHSSRDNECKSKKKPPHHHHHHH